MVRRNTSQQERLRRRIAATGADCHICGAAIAYELRWPDPMCFVVDHIVPIAKGGKHDLSNAAAAHAACNSKKRAREYAPIVRRSGSLR